MFLEIMSNLPTVSHLVYDGLTRLSRHHKAHYCDFNVNAIELEFLSIILVTQFSEIRESIDLW